MTDIQLAQQFVRCERWNDPDQWDYLAIEYSHRGYTMNAAACFRRADDIRGVSFAESPRVEIRAAAAV